MSLSNAANELFECPEGFLFYDRARDRLHLLNESGLLVWDLVAAQMTADAIARYLASVYLLPEPPSDDVQSVMDALRREGLSAMSLRFGDAPAGSVPAQGLGDRKLSPPLEKVTGRELGGASYIPPSIVSFPVDGLDVTSAKCSSRWANLDDNTCYASPLGDSGPAA